MACNCGTKEEIDRVYKSFGERLNDGDTSFIGILKKIVYTGFTLLSWLVILPFMFIYMILFLFWNEPGKRKINVRDFNLLKIFHLKQYARE